MSNDLTLAQAFESNTLSEAMMATGHLQASELISRTGRIKLIQASEENDAAVAALRSHPETRRYLRWFPETCSVEEVHHMRESRLASTDVHDLHVMRTERGERQDGEETGMKFVGATGVFHIDTTHRSCELGILISPEVHRTGVATDVLYTMFGYIFEDLRMHRVYMKTDSGNVSMRGWLEKVAGVEVELVEREAWADLVNGGYSDVVGYAILENEWRERIKGVLEKKLAL